MKIAHFQCTSIGQKNIYNKFNSATSGLSAMEAIYNEDDDRYEIKYNYYAVTSYFRVPEIFIPKYTVMCNTSYDSTSTSYIKNDGYFMLGNDNYWPSSDGISCTYFTAN